MLQHHPSFSFSSSEGEVRHLSWMRAPPMEAHKLVSMAEVSHAMKLGNVKL